VRYPSDLFITVFQPHPSGWGSLVDLSDVMKISLDQAAALIREGKLAAFPTETVYGLGANALDATAVAKIFEMKGRPSSSPLIVHVSSIEMAREIVTDWPPEADELARRYWPGPLTLVLPKSPKIPDIVTAGLPTVGIRVPAHPIAISLIEAAGVPIAAPSANRFMGLSPTTAEHVMEAFGEKVPVLDGGTCPIGIESTVVSIVGGKIMLLRPGMISITEMDASPLGSPAEIEEARAKPVYKDVPYPSPGMHPRHYSPRTRLIVVPGPNHLPDRYGAYLWRKKPGLTARSVRMPMSLEAFAHRWYSVLHELDGEGWPWIAVEALPEKPEWAAIRDRVSRASI
jgi:L-threonylcarbamoyladenylate synthase